MPSDPVAGDLPAFGIGASMPLSGTEITLGRLPNWLPLNYFLYLLLRLDPLVLDPADFCLFLQFSMKLQVKWPDIDNLSAQSSDLEDPPPKLDPFNTYT